MASKSTWIMLRGLAREKGHWGPFLEHFARAFPSEEVLAIDLPGAGEFREMQSPATIGEICKFVRQQASARVPAKTPLKLFAVSLGAMVAMEWLRQSPQDLAGCVLVNASSRESPVYYRMRWQVWVRFLRLVALPVAREREHAVIDLIMNNPEARDMAHPTWTKIATERPISFLNVAAQLRAAARFSSLTTAPEVPTLLLTGLGDRLVDPSCSEKLHSLWGWPIRRHPWAGHDLTWDDPSWVLRNIPGSVSDSIT